MSSINLCSIKINFLRNAENQTRGCWVPSKNAINCAMRAHPQDTLLNVGLSIGLFSFEHIQLPSIILNPWSVRSKNDFQPKNRFHIFVNFHPKEGPWGWIMKPPTSRRIISCGLTWHINTWKPNELKLSWDQFYEPNSSLADESSGSSWIQSRFKQHSLEWLNVN